MTIRRRLHVALLTSVILTAGAWFAAAAGAPVSAAAGATVGQLDSQLSAQQARQQSLSTSLGRLSGVTASLQSQIALVQSREAAVRAELSRDRAALAATQHALARQRRLLARLRVQLARARMLLSQQLVSSYEGERPDLVSVVLNAQGFTDLLEKLDFLHRAERQQQSIISFTRGAKTRADDAIRRLASLEATNRGMTAGAALQVRALDGMNSLLAEKQRALAQVTAAQQAALVISRARGGQLRSQIAGVHARQAAAARAAAARAAAAAVAAASSPSSPASSPPSSSSSSPVGSGPALGPSGGWAIPHAVVLCESGGQNLPPNRAGASGYYQILPSTWKLYGGGGPAAYLAGKSEQDAVAGRIWQGSAGASQWVCAGIVGIH